MKRLIAYDGVSISNVKVMIGIIDYEWVSNADSVRKLLENDEKAMLLNFGRRWFNPFSLEIVLLEFVGLENMLVMLVDSKFALLDVLGKVIDDHKKEVK